MFLNPALVNSSLNSNNWNLEAVEIAFSITINNLRTLMRSNALGFDCAVLSPYKIVPWPGNEQIGFILARYKMSLLAFCGL